MSVGGGKKPKGSRARPAVPPGRIQPSTGASASTERLVPWFSMEYTQPSHCTSGCQEQVKAALLDRLHKLSQMTWAGIKASDRQKLGFETIADKSMKVGIPPVVPRDGIQSTYFNGRDCRLIGFRDGRTFHIVWVDSDLSCYHH